MAEFKSYTTVLGESEDCFEEKKSRFIGTIVPVTTEEEALAYIAEKKTKYWDASHTVDGYVLREGGIRRHSAGGEPAGTAGGPILDGRIKTGLTAVVATGMSYSGGS